MLRSALAAAVTCLLGLSLAGCSGPYYLNIPHESGDVASENPNSESVRDLLSKACNEVIAMNNLSGPVRINLPDVTSTETQKIVAKNVRGAVPPGAQSDPEAETTLKVVAIRIRGGHGEVSIQAPTRPGAKVPQLHSVEADWAMFSEWTVQDVHVWRGVTGDEG